MTIAFTSVMSIFIIERIDERKGTISLIPLLMAGIISILYWRQAHYLFLWFKLYRVVISNKLSICNVWSFLILVNFNILLLIIYVHVCVCVCVYCEVTCFLFCSKMSYDFGKKNKKPLKNIFKIIEKKIIGRYCMKIS